MENTHVRNSGAYLLLILEQHCCHVLAVEPDGTGAGAGWHDSPIAAAHQSNGLSVSGAPAAVHLRLHGGAVCRDGEVVDAPIHLILDARLEGATRHGTADLVVRDQSRELRRAVVG